MDNVSITHDDHRSKENTRQLHERTKTQRQLRILAFLTDHTEGLDTAMLHRLLVRDGFEVDIRTVRRDITDLSVSFGVQEVELGRSTKYLIGAIKLGNLALDYNDMKALYILEELVKPYQHLDIGLRMQKFLSRVKGVIPSICREWLEQISRQMSINYTQMQVDKDASAEIRSIIDVGIREHKCIHIKYHGMARNIITERTVEPLQIEISEGAVHLLAFCRKTSSIRDFRISRITSAILLEDTYQPRITLLEEYRKNRFLSMGNAETERIVIKFYGYSARYVKEYDRDQAESLIENIDGSFTFYRTASVTDDLVRWILGYGDEAEVLEPEQLRALVTKKAYKMLGRYT